MQNNPLKMVMLISSLLFTSASADEQLAGRRLAVVVGIDKYRVNGGLGDLAHAEADAVSVTKALRDAGFTVIEMTYQAAREPGNEHLVPTRTNIRDVISGVLDTPNLGRKDTVLISLHGHGVHYDEITTANEKVPRFYFCPADTSITGLTTANEVTDRNSLISTDELYKALGDCDAATRLLIVDACRNDPNRTEEFRTAPLASKTMPKLPPPPGGIVAFYSCKANQMAIEDKDLGHGVFSHFLVQGLTGRADQPLEGSPADGIVTMSELTSYVANNTYSHVLNKYKGRHKQSPDIRGEFDTNLPLAKIQASANTVSLFPVGQKFSEAESKRRRQKATAEIEKFGGWDAEPYIRGKVHGPARSEFKLEDWERDHMRFIMELAAVNPHTHPEVYKARSSQFLQAHLNALEKGNGRDSLKYLVPAADPFTAIERARIDFSTVTIRALLSLTTSDERKRFFGRNQAQVNSTEEAIGASLSEQYKLCEAFEEWQSHAPYIVIAPTLLNELSVARRLAISLGAYRHAADLLICDTLLDNGQTSDAANVFAAVDHLVGPSFYLASCPLVQFRFQYGASWLEFDELPAHIAGRLDDEMAYENIRQIAFRRAGIVDETTTEKKRDLELKLRLAYIRGLVRDLQ